MFRQLNDQYDIKILNENDEPINVDVTEIEKTTNTIILHLEGLQLKKGRKTKDV